MLSIDALKFLRSAAASAPEALDSVALDAAAGRELETAHRRLIHVHLEKELKSARVLREISHGSNHGSPGLGADPRTRDAGPGTLDAGLGTRDSRQPTD
jgi:hypothetical protein